LVVKCVETFKFSLFLIFVRISWSFEKMSSSSFTYGIVFTGDSTAFQVAKRQVAQGLQDLTHYTVTFGETSERVSQISTRGLSRLIFGTQMLTWFTSMAMTASLRQEAALLSVEQAQENYNEAVRRYGMSSRQARRAARQLERAQLYVARANQMAAFSMVSMGLQIAQMGVQIASQFKILDIFIAKLATIKALSGPLGWIALLGAGAVAAGAWAYAFGPTLLRHRVVMTGIGTYQGLRVGPINVSVAGRGDLHRAFEEAEYRATMELRRKGGR
jgi:hypothetical protein